MAEKYTVQLKSSDGKIFEVKEAIVLQSRVLKNFIETGAQHGNDSHALRIIGAVGLFFVAASFK